MAIVPKSTPQISELNRDKLNPSPLMSRQYVAEGVAHSINCFLGSKPRVWPWAPQKPGTVARACIPALGVEKDPPQLYSKFKARLRPCQEKGGWFQARYYVPLIPSLRNQRQEDLCEFGATWEYTANSRTVKITQRPCQKKEWGGRREAGRER